MTDECPNCRHGAPCDACLDFAHTAHLAGGFDRAVGCVRCEPKPVNRSAQEQRPMTGALTIDALRVAAERLKQPRETPLPIGPDLLSGERCVVLPPDAAVDLLASVEVRVSPHVDGVPLATRCRLAQLPDSVFVTAKELLAMLPRREPNASFCAACPKCNGGGRL